MALPDARLLGEQAGAAGAPRRCRWPAPGRRGRSRARGGRTRCGSRPTSPCRRGAGGSAGRRAWPGRGRRAGRGTSASLSAEDRLLVLRRPRRGRSGGRRASRRPLRDLELRAERRAPVAALDGLEHAPRAREAGRRRAIASSNASTASSGSIVAHPQREVLAERARLEACPSPPASAERLDRRRHHEPRPLADVAGVGADADRDGHRGGLARRTPRRSARRSRCRGCSSSRSPARELAFAAALRARTGRLASFRQGRTRHSLDRHGGCHHSPLLPDPHVQRRAADRRPARRRRGGGRARARARGARRDPRPAGHARWSRSARG